ncbi:MAG: hypothetical protein KAT74_06630 [Candidatus Cloacimonetes bacterium]|nr:hypothetical protein [Candidatus Cloacimonadota bacterium]
MNITYELSHSTYSGYNIIIPRITYISKVGFNNKLKEYYLEIGYDSTEYNEFIMSFSSEEEAEIKREEIIEIVNQYYSSKKK